MMAHPMHIASHVAQKIKKHMNFFPCFVLCCEFKDVNFHCESCESNIPPMLPMSCSDGLRVMRTPPPAMCKPPAINPGHIASHLGHPAPNSALTDITAAAAASMYARTPDLPVQRPPILNRGALLKVSGLPPACDEVCSLCSKGPQVCGWVCFAANYDK